MTSTGDNCQAETHGAGRTRTSDTIKGRMITVRGIENGARGETATWGRGAVATGGSDGIPKRGVRLQ